MLFDTHFHPFHVKEILKTKTNNTLSLENIINTAQKEGITSLMCVSTDLEDSIFNYNFSLMNPSFFASIGIHPCDIHINSFETIKKEFDILIKKDQFKKIKAIGEIGLDLYRDTSNLEKQTVFFKHQIDYALEHNLPIIIHSRNAQEETLKILDEYKYTQLKGIIHCFANSFDIAQEFIQRNFFLGIGAYITYPKNNIIRETITKLNLDHCVLETDAPFLPPQHLRGNMNEPLHIKTIALFLSEILTIPLEIISKKTTSLTNSIFNIKD